MKMHLKLSSGNWQPFCLSLSVLSNSGQSGTKTKFSRQNLASNFSNHLVKATKIGSQCLFNFSTWLILGLLLVPCQMATNNGSPHLQIGHYLSGLYLTDWKWLHRIVIALNTLCPVQFYIHWCTALHWTHWGSYFAKLIFPCLGI